jgi:hypothetical protein
MFLEVSLVRRGYITADQFVQAVEWQLSQRPRLGRLALESGKLTMKQVFAVLEAQADGDKPFGETAVELGYVTRRQVNALLKQQTQRTLPLSQCLLEIGALDPETLAQASACFRHEQTGPSRRATAWHNTTLRRPAPWPACAADEAEAATC